MKKIFVLITCSLLLSCSKDAFNDTQGTSTVCDCSNPPTEILVWDYPVKPGMEEWKKFHSYEEMVNACQIPEKILFSLSTEELTKICLQYPPLYNVFAFNFLSMGADKLYDDFNGIRELFKRKETSKELLRHYNCMMQNLSLLDGTDTNLEKGNYIISIDALHFLLGFYSLKGNATKDDYKKMLQCLVHGYEGICKYTDYFNYSGFYHNFYARAHVIIKISPQSLEEFPLKERNGVFHGWPSPEIMEIINKLSYQLIK